jgi:hypothetical protein
MQSGVPCCRGPFVEHEKQLIDNAIKRYQKVCRTSKTNILFLAVTFVQEHNLDDNQLDDLIHPDAPCYRPLDPGTSPLRSTGILATRTTQWSWMTLSSGKIGLVLLVYASPDVDGLHESPCDSAPMYVTRSPVSSCPAPCAQYPVPCTL